MDYRGYPRFARPRNDGCLALILIAVTHQPGGRASRPRSVQPVHQRFLGARASPRSAMLLSRHSGSEAVPIGVVGDHKAATRRRVDAPARAPASTPMRRPRPDRGSGASSGPARRRRAERDGAGKLGLRRASRGAQLAQCNSARYVIARQRLHRAVQVDRRIVASLTNERDHTLRPCRSEYAPTRCARSVEQPRPNVGAWRSRPSGRHGEIRVGRMSPR